MATKTRKNGAADALALLQIGVIGYGIWWFFFRPPPKDCSDSIFRWAEGLGVDPRTVEITRIDPFPEPGFIPEAYWGLTLFPRPVGERGQEHPAPKKGACLVWWRIEGQGGLSLVYEDGRVVVLRD